MNTKEIKKCNSEQFLVDFKSIYDVVVYSEKTGDYFRTTKREVLKVAERSKIKYRMTREVYINNRLVMLIV